MFWTILALLLMVGMSGFIAYYGDVQGTRWGKRKKLLFGLRPRYTASLIATLTGAFIALLSIVTILAVSKPIRDIVLRGESTIRNLNNNNHSLKAQNADLMRQRLEADNRIRDLRNSEQVRTAELDNFNRIHAALKTQLAQKLAQKAQLDKQLASLRNDYAQTRQQLALAKEKLQAALLTNSRETDVNRETSAQNVALERQNVEIQKKIAAKQREIAANEQKLTEQTQQLAKQQHDEAALEEGNKQILADNTTLAQQKEDLNQKIQEQTAELNKLTQELNVVVSDKSSVENSYLALRQGKFSLRVGAELGRRTLDAHLRPEAVRREVNALLDEASAVAQTHGAARSENGRAVRIISKRMETLAGTQYADENASIEALTESLTGSDTPVVLVVHAVNNSVEGEQVLIELTAYAVRRIFDKGETVASFQLNARQPTDRIFEQLVQFLNTQVREAVLKAGIVPQTDPETGQQSVGSIEHSDLLKLTERIRRMRGQVIVTAVATNQTTSADPIRLTFQLSRPPVAATTTP